jgi:hypothetical protein
MGVADDIIAARRCGIVGCGLSSQPSPSLAELAREFGLSDDLSNYREIDGASARHLVGLALSQDLAYNAVVVPATQAVELADRFLAQFGTEGVRFYTNGDFHEVWLPKLSRTGASWNPVTSATFDTGVLIVGPRSCGCLWVEDEN